MVLAVVIIVAWCSVSVVLAAGIGRAVAIADARRALRRKRGVSYLRAV